MARLSLPNLSFFLSFRAARGGAEEDARTVGPFNFSGSSVSVSHLNNPFPKQAKILVFAPFPS